jgi:MarR family transcriptional regulator for hemolysin
MPQASEVFGERLFQATSAWRNEMDKRLRPLGLSRSKWTLLMALSRGGAGLTQTALAQRVHIEGPTLVGLLDRLERDGLVERRAADGDRRANAVHLSEKGKALIGTIRTIAAGLRRDLVTGLDTGELETALRVLSHVKAKAESLP